MSKAGGHADMVANVGRGGFFTPTAAVGDGRASTWAAGIAIVDVRGGRLIACKQREANLLVERRCFAREMKTRKGSAAA